MLSRLFIAALWSPAGKGLTSCLSFVRFNFVFVTFPYGILGQVWYLIVSIPDLLLLFRKQFAPWENFLWSKILPSNFDQFFVCFDLMSHCVEIVN